MLIGIPKEILSKETRVAATPEIVKKLIASNHTVNIEKNAGDSSFISDEEFQKVGATIKESTNEIYQSDIIFKVNPPNNEELEMIKEGSSLITFFQIKDQVELLNKYVDKKITLFSMNHVPRTTLAQNMDALSSQSNIAGYKAAIIGASYISKYMPLLMTAAGTIQPAKVLILGAGVAGLAAIATAKRLGAQVFAFDVRPVVKEQVESLGAKFVEVETDNADDGVGDGGYAKETSDEYKKKQSELIAQTIAKMDLVISTALIPERPAPILITKEMVENMKPGSAIMDLAAANGGNCEITKQDEVINHNGITIDGIVNIPGTMPTHATSLYAKNLNNLFSYLYKEENEELNMEDEIVNGSMLFNKGDVNNDIVKKFMDKG
tara:strand:+ start:2486 stop:3622 length:1137 start_codon:yes stop_codon:yes gene_type:complete